MERPTRTSRSGNPRRRVPRAFARWRSRRRSYGRITPCCTRSSRRFPRSPDLSQLYFVNTVESASFDSELPDDWKHFGDLKLQADHGLRPLVNPNVAGFKGGGIIWQRSIQPNQPFALEASILPAPSSHDVVQLFITDEPNFEGTSATSPHELVWLLNDTEMNVVLPGGRVEAQIPVATELVKLEGRKAWRSVHEAEVPIQTPA